jgi:VanZ family protein
MGLILYLSGDAFGSSRTLYALQYWSSVLGLSPRYETLLTLNFFVRKAAHFGEFFVLGLLAYRALWGPALEFRLQRAWVVVAGGVLFAFLDEFRQTQAEWRSASAWDAVIDSLGILFSQFWIYVRRRFLTTSRVPAPR